MVKIRNKKGTVTLYIVFIVMAILITFIAAFIIPIASLFNTQVYAAGEDIMLWGNETAQEIQNSEIRESLTQSFSDATASTDSTVTMLNSLYKYSWLLIIGVSAIIIFMYSRRLVEVGGGLY